MEALMTKHPAAGMTKVQRSVFESIAVGNTPYCDPRTIKALLQKGLIVELSPKTIGRDRFGPIQIPQYEVPIAHHMVWCEWCSEQKV
jgi:hypothetical protein